MINKLEFNNLVNKSYKSRFTLLTENLPKLLTVYERRRLCKKRIQRVKAQTNQKLIQKIKKLKYTLDKNPEHERNKERLGKATLSLEELKKFKCVDLMKQVLVLDKSPTAILTNGLSAPEEIAIAMVALNKTMQEIVKSFQDKLGLTAENKTWREELLQASKRRIKILRTEMKRKNRQEMKEQKVIARKRTEWLKTRDAGDNENSGDDKEEDVEEDAEENDEGANVSTLGYWKIEPIEGTSKSTKKDVKSKQKRERAPKLNDAKENKKQERKGKAEHVEKSPKKVELPTEKLATAVIEKDTIAKLDDTSFNSIASDFKDNKRFAETPKVEITHVVDPFFITASGENYRSTAVVIRDGQVLETQTNNANEDKRNFDKGSYIRPATDKTKMNTNMNRADKRAMQKNRTVSKTLETNNTNGLHPSWVAKQKLKPVIGGFQGKKIKFDDDDNFDTNTNGMSASVKSNDDRVSNKKHTKSAANNNSNNLHPSWAAKQKMKPAITDFKGKKITFGNEGDAVNGVAAKNNTASTTKQQHVKQSSAVESGLHPSWLAKQKQKPAITAFQGKKITFGDDD